MEIQVASLRDLGALRRLESAVFEKDAWPLLDLVAVLTWSDVVRLKAVIDHEMVGFVAGHPRSAQYAGWIATYAGIAGGALCAAGRRDAHCQR
jgi:hypothetical protein